MPPRRRTNYAAAANREAPTPKPAVQQIRTKDVRITVDLKPDLHDEVKAQVRHLAASAGRDVPLAAVARALFTIWLSDSSLAAQVRTTIADQQH